MSDRPEPRAKSPGAASVTLIAAVLVVVFLVLPVLYVLSVGPVVWLHKHGYVSESVGVIYFPLALLAKYIPPVERALEWYVNLWE